MDSLHLFVGESREARLARSYSCFGTLGYEVGLEDWNLIVILPLTGFRCIVEIAGNKVVLKSYKGRSEWCSRRDSVKRRVFLLLRYLVPRDARDLINESNVSNNFLMGLLGDSYARDDSPVHESREIARRIMILVRTGRR